MFIARYPIRNIIRIVTILTTVAIGAREHHVFALKGEHAHPNAGQGKVFPHFSISTNEQISKATSIPAGRQEAYDLARGGIHVFDPVFVTGANGSGRHHLAVNIHEALASAGAVSEVPHVIDCNTTKKLGDVIKSLEEQERSAAKKTIILRSIDSIPHLKTEEFTRLSDHYNQLDYSERSTILSPSEEVDNFKALIQRLQQSGHLIIGTSNLSLNTNTLVSPVPVLSELFRRLDYDAFSEMIDIPNEVGITDIDQELDTRHMIIAKALDIDLADKKKSDYNKALVEMYATLLETHFRNSTRTPGELATTARRLIPMISKQGELAYNTADATYQAELKAYKETEDLPEDDLLTKYALNQSLHQEYGERMAKFLDDKKLIVNYRKEDVLSVSEGHIFERLYQAYRSTMPETHPNSIRAIGPKEFMGWVMDSFESTLAEHDRDQLSDLSGHIYARITVSEDGTQPLLELRNHNGDSVYASFLLPLNKMNHPPKEPILSDILTNMANKLSPIETVPPVVN